MRMTVAALWQHYLVHCVYRMVYIMFPVFSLPCHGCVALSASSSNLTQILSLLSVLKKGKMCNTVEFQYKPQKHNSATLYFGSTNVTGVLCLSCCDAV